MICTNIFYSVDFPILTTVYQSVLSINSSAWVLGQEIEHPFVNISFPVLENAPVVDITGNISRYDIS